MGEKFRKVVNAPHKVVGRINRKIEATQPNKTWGMMLREAGLLTTDMLRFLLWATKYVALDNHVLRAGEKKLRNMRVGKNKEGKDKKLSAFGKKYPNLSAHLVYYLIAAMAFGGTKVYQKSAEEDNNEGKVKTEWVVPVLFDDGKERVISFDVNTVNGALFKYWNEIAIGITELETYRIKPKVQGSESRATTGPGLTWRYSLDEKGQIIKDEATEAMPALSYDENYSQQMVMHLEYETLPKMLNATRGLDNITDKQKVALIFAGYQRPADIALIVSHLKTAKTKQQIADAFMDVGDIHGKYRDGTLKRRWVCAAYAVGIIDTNDLLDMQRDAFSAVKNDLSDIIKNGHFKLDAETVKYVLSRRKQNNNNTVREFLSGFDTGRKVLAGEQVEFPEVKINYTHYNKIEEARRAAKAKAAKKGKKSQKPKSQKKSKKGQKKKINKTQAFNGAIKKLGNYAHSADFDITHLLQDGHDMA